ncbi:Wzz/FepE/Etk N-terminal domain-containing protein [Peribacillus frigoritolerans]|uniref:YveK family protein n=1 Tax=Peribacillus frigoritolerans TaxID=450367 RepID=UPI002B253BA1|nr:Wzz/FepE/Etk N-terminal domain-containing protein [Peribacillus frigoritolerans]MEB2492982.1 Wzz/FepE/Etk N-terminal domain-containing protein [Peribacillus frigoritolerans]
MEETISIKDIFQTLMKRWKLITLLTLIAALISGSISYFLLTPVYQASTQILVNQKQSKNQLDSNQIQSNIDMINTYSVIIKSPAILEKVINNLELPQSVDQLSQRITINSQENSQVFSLTVQDSNPAKAVEIANTVSATFQKEIKEIMNVDNVSILAKAEVKENPTPVKPSPLLNIAIAVVVGLMAGIGLAFLLEYMDNTIRDEKDIETLLDLPLLGSIQKISQHK